MSRTQANKVHSIWGGGLAIVPDRVIPGKWSLDNYKRRVERKMFDLTVHADTLEAFADFLHAGWVGGFLPKLLYYNAFGGADITTARIPLINETGQSPADQASTGGTAHTFAEDVGITASGAGWWDIGFSPADIGTTLVALGGCVHTLKNGEVLVSPAAEELVGSFSVQFTRWVGGNYAQFFLTDESGSDSVGSVATSAWIKPGEYTDSYYFLGQRTNATTLKLYDGEGNAISATTASCPATPSQAQHYYVFASNRDGTGAVRFSDRIHGSAYLALALTDAEAAALLAADAELQTALGR